MLRYRENKFDIIVVGGGHAGCEAALAAANLGSKVLMITLDMTKIAMMSCNPAMGGIAKGQIVREIDALGGASAIVTDRSTLQFRMLNRSKGPAMWSPRAQCDRSLFSSNWRQILESNDNIFLWQDSVISLIIRDNTVEGVVTKLGNKFHSKAVILTSGTFMNGLMHIGQVQIEGGRASDLPSGGITEQLVQYGMEAGRMKTGTSARIDGRSVDFSKMVIQDGDIDPGRFSYMPGEETRVKQLPCFITYTNSDVHEILRTGFEESPLFRGDIKGVGPRYCPSVEDKIVTFPGKERHQLFLEPEGWKTCEYYINGFSSSLPQDVQIEALRQVKGLENVRIFRPGYAIEYDYFPPTQLNFTLETKLIVSLYFAGQINGTTGYEEAAGQGLIAGINAHLKINGKNEFVLSREQAYIGVLIDDLITKGVDEPYRMFTSRAEYRLLLRQDNADERLTELSYEIGLAGKDRLELLKFKREKISSVLEYISNSSVKPDGINYLLEKRGTSPIKQKIKCRDILTRPQITIDDLIEYDNNILCGMDLHHSLTKEVVESVEILVKYKGYLERERELAAKISRLESIRIPVEVDYNSLKSISTEGRQKLTRIQPSTIGQATRISGVSPADINVLLIYLGR